MKDTAVSVQLHKLNIYTKSKCDIFILIVMKLHVHMRRMNYTGCKICDSLEPDELIGPPEVLLCHLLI